MKRLFLSVGLSAAAVVALNAQTVFEITNSVTLANDNCELTRTDVIMPVPQSNIYQDITRFEYSSGEVIATDSRNMYLRDTKTSGLPMPGFEYSVVERFDVTLYSMYVDMSQFKTVWPYDTESETYRMYTADKGEYIDTHNGRIGEIADRLWVEANGKILDYARLCYEHVGSEYRYLNPNTGIHRMEDILSAGGGDCGNLASIFVNLLRTKGIPARHIVTVRPDGTFHVWADFYLERYGWIPVDVNMKLYHPEGDYFGWCCGDGIVMSVDICHRVELESGQAREAVILQNFLYWYGCRSGDGMRAEHRVEGRSVSVPSAPSVSVVGRSGAVLNWTKVNGATGYRIELYEKGGDLPVRSMNIKACRTSKKIRCAESGAEYTVRFIPLRRVGNIDTQMNGYTIGFRTE